MADVFPFRGIHYNTEKIGDLSRVTTPPYDVISPPEQDRAYDRHPHNVIRLILNRTSKEDTETDNRYTRAAGHFRRWRAADVLVQDREPAFYLNATGFSVAGHRMTRLGLLARVRLEPFDKGIVLPHETTYSRIKTDRLALMKTCHANFSPIFTLYPDPDRLHDLLAGLLTRQTPDVAFVDTTGHRQQLWRLTDPDLLGQVTETLAARQLFIADGHHRYETALAYRDYLAETTPGFSPDHPANFILMSLTSIQDPGLVVLPAHRILTRLDLSRRENFLSDAEPCFDITPFPFSPDRWKERLGDLTAALRTVAEKHAIGVCIKERTEMYLLKLKPGAMERTYGDTIAGPLKALDVTVLTRLILGEMLGLGAADLDDEDRLAYTSVAETAADAVLSGRDEMAFLLNPTPVAQVQQVAREGLIMPRKSTYFYPKVITGLVFHSLRP